MSTNIHHLTDALLNLEPCCFSCVYRHYPQAHHVCFDAWQQLPVTDSHGVAALCANYKRGEALIPPPFAPPVPYVEQ